MKVEVNEKSYRETAHMMNACSFAEQFKAEYIQAKWRYSRIKNLVDKYDNGTLAGEPIAPIHLYRKQEQSMREYIAALEERALYEVKE